MNIKIQIDCSDSEVEGLIGQHPMGELDKKVEIVVGGRSWFGLVEGYAASNGRATLVIYASDES